MSDTNSEPKEKPQPPPIKPDVDLYVDIQKGDKPPSKKAGRN